MHLFPTPSSGTSGWRLYVGHQGDIYTPEIGKPFFSVSHCPSPPLWGGTSNSHGGGFNHPRQVPEKVLEGAISKSPGGVLGKA